jgi:hypothetical protein
MKKFSKLIIGKFLNEMVSFLLKKNKIVENDGTHQLLKDFNGNLIIAIKNLHLPDTDENWDKKREAETLVYGIINKILDYGKVEMSKILLTNFDLYEVLRKEKLPNIV